MWRYYYNVSPIKILKSCFGKGYYVEASPKDILRKLFLTELKTILKEKGLKVSGNKEVLVDRILEVLSEKEIIERYYKEKFYVLSEKANKINEQNKFLKLYEEYFAKEYADEITLFQFFKTFEANGSDGLKNILKEISKKILKKKNYDDLCEIYIDLSELTPDIKEKLENLFKAFYIECSGALETHSDIEFFRISENKIENMIETLKYDNIELKNIFLKSIKILNIKEEVFSKEEIFDLMIRGLDTSFSNITDYINKKLDDYREQNKSKEDYEEGFDYEEESLQGLTKIFKFLYRNIITMKGQENDFNLYSFDESNLLEILNELDYTTEKFKTIYFECVDVFTLAENFFSKEEIFDKIILQIINDDLMNAVVYIEEKVANV